MEALKLFNLAIENLIISKRVALNYTAFIADSRSNITQNKNQQF